jgi:hypothetical protein
VGFEIVINMHANERNAFCDGVSIEVGSKLSNETEETEDCELYDCLLPLFKVMETWGFYFKSDMKHNECANSDVEQKEWSREAKTAGGARGTLSKTTTPKWRKYYSAIVLVVLWINALRFTTSFERSDRFGLLLITKLVTVPFGLLSTISQTSYFVASYTGHLDSVLRSIHVNPMLAKRLRRHSSFLGYTSYIGCFMTSGFVAYLLFYRDDEYAFALAPFVTQIEVSQTSRVAVKIFCILLDLISKNAFIMPFLMNFVLTFALIEKFRSFNDRFRKAASNRHGFDGDLAAFRRHHRTLCHEVRLIDQVLMVCNAASFCCNLFSLVWLFYGLLVLGYKEAATSFVFAASLTGSLTDVAFNVSRGSAVHYAVYTII